jgi:hypothetical protein
VGVEDVDAGIVKLGDEAAQGDRFADTTLANDEGDAVDLGPHGQAGVQFALTSGIKHLQRDHVLAKRDFGKAEMGLQAAFVFGGDSGLRAHGVSLWQKVCFIALR